MPEYSAMSRAIQLAEKPVFSPHPNPRVGCVITRDQTIVGEGFHAYAGGPHAEITALAQAGDFANGATVYVTLEPCCFHGRTPPCVDALIRARVAKVIIAMLDPNPKVSGQGVALLQQAGIDVISGVMKKEAEALNKGFIQRMTLGRPWVRCKMAMSLDGRTAMADGESQWITGEPARQDVQRYRAKSDAILTGIGTVLADNPRMTVRDEHGIETTRQPLRVIVDSELKADAALRIFQASGAVLIGTLRDLTANYPENTTVKQFPTEASGVNLSALLHYLASQEINEVQVEAGAKLCGTLLQAQLIDELIIYMAPSILGDSARGLFALPALQRMQDKITLRCLDVRQIGQDFRFTLQPEYQ